ncbi:MAG: hypothetical protein KA956_03425 [Pyrinomonadaceae bacterium]|nr:hypothetical protein [Acidobacteriota bacterium]MBP7375512.1 hypothetical protein [Pyrinomonadaceae bacterium]
MKRFIFSILCVAVFFAGLGSIVQTTGAKFKSDEKALDVVRRARVAIGGDAAIAQINSMVIKGRSVHGDKGEVGETEIALQLPDKMMRMVKIGSGDQSASGEPIIDKQIDVVVVGAPNGQSKLRVEGLPVDPQGDTKGQMKVMVNEEDNGNGPVRRVVIKRPDGTTQELTGAEADKMIAAHPGKPGENVKRIVIKKDDGTVQELTGAEADKMIAARGEGHATFTSKDGKTFNVRLAGGADAHHGAMKQNELLRTTLSLLLTAPQGIDVEYTYGGETSIDGIACDLVNATFGGATYKLLISRASSLPVAMTYTGHKMPQVIKMRKAATGDASKEKDVVVFTKKLDEMAETAEFTVRFTDYRSTGGIQLPYRWATTIGDKAAETFDVASYEINPADIADRFNGNGSNRVMIRTKKPDSN